MLDLRALHKDLRRLIRAARSARSICCSLLTEPGCRVSARSEMTSRRCHRPSTRLRSLCRQASQPLGTFQNSRGRFRSGVSGSAGITAQGFAPTESPSMPSFQYAFHLVSRAPLRCPLDHRYHPCLRLLASNPSVLTLAAAEVKRPACHLTENTKALRA